MSNVPVIDCVRHYQRSIERANNDEKKLLHCFAKLYKLPITVEHLSETGIGKIVNNFRKVEGEVGMTAKALVAKWKTMVADARETSPEEQAAVPAYEPQAQSDNEQLNHLNHTIKAEKSHQHKSRHEHKKEDSSKHKEKERSHRETHSERSERKERERLAKEKRRESNEHKKVKSEHQEEPTTSNAAEIKEVKREKLHDAKKAEERTHKHSKHERHKEHKHEKSTSHRDNDSKHHHKSSSRTEKRVNTENVEEIAKKRTKLAHKSEEVAEEVNDDGIDSSMGANFEDVLGALNVSAGSSRKFKKSATNNAHNKPSSSNKSMESASTSKKAVELQKPILLTSAAKLQPLDPNLTLELPTISNNYRPMPLNKTVMDCVFNNTSNGNCSKNQTRMFSDSDALAHGISSKTMRTKIYSGVKSGQVFQVPSLFNLCIRLLQKNIDALEYTGGVPYEVLKPVLERATPEQLFVFEEYNPYILEDSDELWKLHVQRKYRTQKRQEMEAWREMFMRCREDEALKLSRLTETIKQKEIMVSAPIKKTQMAFVDSYAKPPRNVARKQEIFGTRAKLIATPAARVAALSSVTPNAASIGDVRLRVAASTSRDTAHASTSSSSRPKKAPLMAKTLQLMRGRLKR